MQKIKTQEGKGYIAIIAFKLKIPRQGKLASLIKINCFMNLHHPALSHVEQRQQYYACVFFESIKTQTAQTLWEFVGL